MIVFCPSSFKRLADTDPCGAHGWPGRFLYFLRAVQKSERAMCPPIVKLLLVEFLCHEGSVLVL